MYQYLCYCNVCCNHCIQASSIYIPVSLHTAKLPANDQRSHCSSIVIQAVNSKAEGERWLFSQWKQLQHYVCMNSRSLLISTGIPLYTFTSTRFSMLSALRLAHLLQYYNVGDMHVYRWNTRKSHTKDSPYNDTYSCLYQSSTPFKRWVLPSIVVDNIHIPILSDAAHSYLWESTYYMHNMWNSRPLYIVKCCCLGSMI